LGKDGEQNSPNDGNVGSPADLFGPWATGFAN
jgi:hypothetical protein